jgi:hypothetical protein
LGRKPEAGQHPAMPFNDQRIGQLISEGCSG